MPFLDHVGIHTKYQLELESSPVTHSVSWRLDLTLPMSRYASDHFLLFVSDTTKTCCLRAEGPRVPGYGSMTYKCCLWGSGWQVFSWSFWTNRSDYWLRVHWTLVRSVRNDSDHVMNDVILLSASQMLVPGHRVPWKTVFCHSISM